MVLSLAVPGAGQLVAGRASCLAWFLAAGVGVALGRWAGQPAGTVALVALAVASAIDAKRGLEPRRRPGVLAPIGARVDCRPWRGAGVDLRIDLVTPRPAAEVWAEVADVERFACIDPFHARLVFLTGHRGPGAPIALEHRAFGARWMRFGRLLSWREGRGYAFSDLSARGPGRGFPHVFAVEVGADAEGRTRLTVRVTGRWTARLVPRPMARAWLRRVATEHARLLEHAL